MKNLPELIMEHAEAAGGLRIYAAALLHKRAAVGEVLSRLPVGSCGFAKASTCARRPASVGARRASKSHSKQLWGETIVPNGGGAAKLGLTDAKVSHIRPQSAIALRQARRRPAPRSPLASWWPRIGTAGSGCPSLGMARPQRDRAGPRRCPAQAFGGRSRRACSRTHRHAHVDGGTAKQTSCPWLRLCFRAFRSKSAAMPSVQLKPRARIRRF